jgi:hypothetical protein
LEGDCVGPTWPPLKPGSYEPGFFLSPFCRAFTSPAFFFRLFAGLSRARLFSFAFLFFPPLGESHVARFFSIARPGSDRHCGISIRPVAWLIDSSSIGRIIER